MQKKLKFQIKFTINCETKIDFFKMTKFDRLMIYTVLKYTQYWM